MSPAARDFTISGSVAITRAEGDDGPLTTSLREKGAHVLHWGSIAFVPPNDPTPLEEALGRLEEYDWVCLSSPRAVEAVLSRVREPPGFLVPEEEPGGGSRAGLRVAAVGPSTARALREAGWPVHRVPEEGRGEALVEAFREAGDAAGSRVLFPASAIARDEIPVGLRELGSRVDSIVAYRMVTVPLDRTACAAQVGAGEVNVVTFASPSAMEGLREGLGDELFQHLVENVPAAAMGPTTAGALNEVGWRTVRVARDASLEALAEAAVELLSD
jgi:uroporphyrinogen-III synthase